MEAVGSIQRAVYQARYAKRLIGTLFWQEESNVLALEESSEFVYFCAEGGLYLITTSSQAAVISGADQIRSNL